ncbi:MAG TPA: ABC transporter ATP-binding protein [Fibrobacteraceae bacterium]|nr:ABC transporter ATP-binding protein [Fibrobacteraceae bacterium]
MFEPTPPLADGVLDLHLSGIHKSFGDHDVLRGISMDITDGEFVTLLGPSGCGKTTLLRIIAGFEGADQGKVMLGKLDMGPLPAHKRPVNTVFQNYAIFPHLSVFENVAFGLRSRKIADSELRQRVMSMMELIRIADLADRQPLTLSGGQRQRVALARALVNEPDVLLLDEPLSAIDASLRHDLQVELKSLQRRTTITFILVTHDQDEAIAVSDRIMVMKDGLIEQQGSPEDVYERPVSRFVAEFLGHANILSAKRMGSLQARTSVGDLVLPSEPSWSEGTLAIRPEDIEVRDSGDAPNSLPGCVQERLFRGDHWELRVDLQGQLVRVITEPDQENQIGQNVFLEMPPDDLQVLRD